MKRADAPATTARTPANGVPRLLLTRQEAAVSLGCSIDFFEDHVQSELRLIRRGRLVFVPTRELERWIERNAARTIDP